MDIDENKAIARRSLEMWAADAQVDAAAVFAEDYVNHQEHLADGGVGSISRRDELARVLEANHRAFPDLAVEIMRQVAEADTVATHWRFSATHEGPTKGRPIDTDSCRSGPVGSNATSPDVPRRGRSRAVVRPHRAAHI